MAHSNLLLWEGTRGIPRGQDVTQESFLKPFQVLVANKWQHLGEPQQSNYIKCLENCTQNSSQHFTVKKKKVLNELLQDLDMDLVQFNIFIKDLDKMQSMLIQFADETKVRQKLH